MASLGFHSEARIDPGGVAGCAAQAGTARRTARPEPRRRLGHRREDQRDSPIWTRLCPSVAMDANGDYVVAWNNQVHLGPNYLYDVEARVYNSAGVSPDGRDRGRPDDGRHASLGGHGRQWRLRRRLSGLECQHVSVRDFRPAVQPRRDSAGKHNKAQRRQLARAPRARCPRWRWTLPATS